MSEEAKQSQLDTAMNRGIAMVVGLSTAAMIKRARILERQHPHFCWVSDISTRRDAMNRPIVSPTFYYLPQGDNVYWVDEEWIQDGKE